MSKVTNTYFALPHDRSWIAYLRNRLPYSFQEISPSRAIDGKRQFKLQKPILDQKQSWAEYHNFWRRGHMYYMSGKLLDFYDGPAILGADRNFRAISHLKDPRSKDIFSPFSIASRFYNSMELERIWGFVQENTLDRERVIGHNISLALELCLKALQTHANYRLSQQFTFKEGHDIEIIYKDLPRHLRGAIERESRVFATEYLAYRTRIEAEVKETHSRQLKPFPDTTQEMSDWYRIGQGLAESTYTAFVQANDPGRTEAELHPAWFKEALARMKVLTGGMDPSEYYRYSPKKDKDELPVELVHQGLLLGRFLYEHLFPVSLDGKDRQFAAFPGIAPSVLGVSSH